MRISGLSGSGLDIDGIVSETMEPYKAKVTNKLKEMKLLQVKQSMYQDIIESSRKFYEKYLNINSTNALNNPNNYKTIAFSSNSPAVSVSGLTGAERDNYTVSVQQLAESASKTILPDQFTAGQTLTITRGTTTRTFTLEGSSQSEIISNLNSALSDAGFNMNAKYSSFANGGTGGIKLQTTATGESASFSIKIGDGATETITGQNAIADITNSAGETVHYNGADNKVALDNVEFTFNSTTVGPNGVDNAAVITSATDISTLKESIVKFVNDYNDLITDLNKKLIDKKDSSYMPLTDEEKSAMTSDEVKLWEEKVQTGLLRNDGDLSRIVSSLKSTMQTMLSGTGLKLEDIGIKPVKDFKEKNGTFAINEDKLDDALKNNLEGVKSLFTSPESSTTLSNGSSYSSGGIMTTLSDIFRTEFVYSSNSALIQKAGTKNSSVSSTITEQLAQRQKIIDKMNDDLIKKENNLYTKYSKLETALTNLYSQQNWLSQQIGN